MCVYPGVNHDPTAGPVAEFEAYVVARGSALVRFAYLLVHAGYLSPG